jgi:glycerol transport system ATP-binding protein
MTAMLDNVSLEVGGQPYIRGVTLKLVPGTINVLLGPTLSGKTSLMRLLAGLDRPTAGRVLVDGIDVTGKPVRERNVAMVYQQFINYPSLTVYENIASPLRVQGLPTAEIEKRVKEAAQLLRLEPYLDRAPLQLSGGQQQRTAIARALVKRAALVLLDEPLANLDFKLREELREELPRIFEASGAIFVYATTEPSEALLLGGNVACLWQGEVLQFGPTADVYRRPQSLKAASVFADPPLNTLKANIASGLVRFDGAPAGQPCRGLLTGLGDGDYTLAFRAHQIRLDQAGGDFYSFPAKVIVTEITGSESFVHLTHANAPWVSVLPGVSALVPGAAATVSIDPANILVFAESGALVRAPDRR